MRKPRISSISGISLIELIVALAISSILAIGIINMYSASKKSYLVQNDSSKLQESGRYVFNMLMNDLRRTGYYGYNAGINSITGTETPIPATNTNTCPNDATWALMLDRRIMGLNDPVTPYACITADYAKGDVLSMHYVDGRNEAVLDPDRYYLRSSFNKGKVFIGSKSADPLNKIADTTPETIGQLRAYAYYIGDSGRTCRFTDANKKTIPVPALYRETLNEKGLPKRQEVASGIENIQFRYGIDNNGDKSVNRYYDAQDINNDETSPHWNEVVSVRFWILTRADCPDSNPKYKNEKTYIMGDKTIIKNDQFRRQLFTSTVALRN